ncbi:hypothetical protein V6Z98_000298 [Aspergillus fumigatus]
MDKAAGETGIFGGGVGGTGELFGTLCSEGHAVDDGIVRLGYRFRFRGEVIEFLVVGDVRLVGRELENEVHSSLKSESTSVTSYRSSKLCICRCHSVSEQDDVVPADNGERRRFSFESERLERPAVMSFSCGPEVIEFSSLGPAERADISLKSEKRQPSCAAVSPVGSAIIFHPSVQ